MNCPVALVVARRQCRLTRLRQRAIMRARIASSRASPPKAFTTALQLTASAKAPPTLLSQEEASRAIGAT